MTFLFSVFMFPVPWTVSCVRNRGSETIRYRRHFVTSHKGNTASAQTCAELIKQFVTRRGRNKVGTRLTNSKCCFITDIMATVNRKVCSRHHISWCKANELLMDACVRSAEQVHILTLRFYYEMSNVETHLSWFDLSWCEIVYITFAFEKNNNHVLTSTACFLLSNWAGQM